MINLIDWLFTGIITLTGGIGLFFTTKEMGILWKRMYPNGFLYTRKQE